MELEAFASAAVAGVPIVFLTFGLVAWVKQLGLSGKWLTVASMLIGLILGGGYQVFVNGLPVNYAGWFVIVIYGLGLGVVASGVYKSAEGLLLKRSPE